MELRHRRYNRYPHALNNCRGRAIHLFLVIQVVVAIRSPSLTYFFFSYFKSASFFRYGPTVRYVDFLQNFCRGIARFGTF